MKAPLSLYSAIMHLNVSHARSGEDLRAKSSVFVSKSKHNAFASASRAHWSRSLSNLVITNGIRSTIKDWFRGSRDRKQKPLVTSATAVGTAEGTEPRSDYVLK